MEEEEKQIPCPNCEGVMMEYDPDLGVYICPMCDYTEDRGD